MSVDGQDVDSQKIDDKYDQSKTRIGASNDDDGEGDGEDGDKRDALTKRREDFLNIYKEGQDDKNEN